MAQGCCCALPRWGLHIGGGYGEVPSSL
uniref:Uncharacterized protein n=1 Tax=Anguilla anguilla TaxID=7936 RepID=A0A0E9S4F2_ANGAN